MSTSQTSAVGRRTLPESERVTKPVTVLLTGDEHDFIVKHASESGRTVSNAIRQLVRAVMAAEDE